MHSNKIAWYREILSLEPSSRLFFPLAQELMQEKCYEEAVQVLQNGLHTAPEHSEARMLYITALEKLGRKEDAAQEAEQLAAVLCRYPAFWRSWNRALQNASTTATPQSNSSDTTPMMPPIQANGKPFGTTSDAALALRVVTAALVEREKFSWRKIVASGLRALDENTTCEISKETSVAPETLVAHSENIVGKSKELSSPLERPFEGNANSSADAPAHLPGAEQLANFVAHSNNAATAPASSPEPSASLQAEQECTDTLKTETVHHTAPDTASCRPRSKSEKPSLNEVLAALAPVLRAPQTKPYTPTEESLMLSLCTRSMAEVLAQQGDIRGAVKIFDELLAQTDDENKRQELSACKEAILQKKPSPSNSADSPNLNFSPEQSTEEREEDRNKEDVALQSAVPANEKECIETSPLQTQKSSGEEDFSQFTSQTTHDIVSPLDEQTKKEQQKKKVAVFLERLAGRVAQRTDEQ